MSRIYTLRDADAILPEIAVVVQRLQDLRDEVIALRDAYRLHEGVGRDPEAARAVAERDVLADGDVAGRGGDAPRSPVDDDLLRIRLRLRGLVDQMQADAAWLDARDIVLRDISTGLLDFPGEAHGRPVWLCWRLGEPSVAAWHAQDEGFAGRRPLDELD